MRICLRRLAAFFIAAWGFSATTTSAQSYTALHTFSAATHFYAPLTQGPDGTLYGVSCNGGLGSINGTLGGSGTVFRINPDGTRFAILYSFGTASQIGGVYTNVDGYGPVGGLVVSNNVLYGTTQYGGVKGYGTVFKINTDGSGFTNLYFFTNGVGGGTLDAGLVLSGGALYGTTYAGGTNANGTIFKLNADGTGFASLHSFGSTNGGFPKASMILSGSTLYGTTQEGGYGTVFEIDTNGTGFAVLHHFPATVSGTNLDGDLPVASLVMSGGTLYGTASGGGRGHGTVFAISADGSGFTNLYSFTNGADGSMPLAGLAVSGNTLYGTTSSGGNFPGYGTVFAVNTDGTGFTNLYDFTGTTGDGIQPNAGVLLSGGALYGTTLNAGGGGNGETIFKLNTNGTGFTVLTYGDDGSVPKAGLVLSGGGTCYGTTSAGGVGNVGTIFQVNTDGTGFAMLHSFAALGAGNTNADGATPLGKLVLSGSTLYGTTSSGGAGYGTIFSLNTNGVAFTNLYTFTNGVDGAASKAGLVLSGNTLYGTASIGGTNGSGAVFKINPDGTGFAPLHNFALYFDSTNADGDFPEAQLLLSGGTLYGTTLYGGTNGGGTLFKLNTNGSSFVNLYEFMAGGVHISNTNGFGIVGDLILSGDTLYGTASGGGNELDNTKSAGSGTIFKINTDGTGFVKLCENVGGPMAGMVQSGATLYGTTSPGAGGGSMVFQVDTNGNNFTTLHAFPALGGTPLDDLILAGNTLYGTSEQSIPGSGSVFALNPAFVPTISFTASPTTGLPPLTVQFSTPGVDSGGNVIQRWNWDFGDGSTNFGGNQFPQHTYATNLTYHPTLIATNVNGAAVFGSGPAIVVTFPTSIQNGGFETGTFINWVLGGQSSSVIGTTTNYVHSGTYGAELDGVGGLGSIAQTIETIPGANYVISFWLHNRVAANPSAFQVLWGGQLLMSQTNLPAFGWTNIQFDVQATATSETLEFDYEYILGLDDVTVALVGSGQPGISQISLSGTNLVVNCSSGQSGQTYYLLMGTNLTEPLVQWIPVASNTPVADGNFSITATNAVSPGAPQRYFILLSP